MNSQFTRALQKVFNKQHCHHHCRFNRFLWFGAYWRHGSFMFHESIWNLFFRHTTIGVSLHTRRKRIFTPSPNGISRLNDGCDRYIPNTCCHHDNRCSRTICAGYVKYCDAANNFVDDSYIDLNFYFHFYYCILFCSKNFFAEKKVCASF